MTTESVTMLQSRKWPFFVVLQPAKVLRVLSPAASWTPGTVSAPLSLITAAVRLSFHSLPDGRVKRMRGALSNRSPCESPCRLDGEACIRDVGIEPLLSLNLRQAILRTLHGILHSIGMRNEAAATRYLAWPTMLWRYVAGLDTNFLHHSSQSRQCGVLVLPVLPFAAPPGHAFIPNISVYDAANWQKYVCRSIVFNNKFSSIGKLTALAWNSLRHTPTYLL